MLKRRLTLGLLLISLILILVYISSLQNNQNGDSSEYKIVDLEGDFAIADTSNVTKITIFDNVTKDEIVLERQSNFVWKLNDEYIARKDAVDLILKTFVRIDVQEAVPQSAQENILKTMAVKHKKVEIYTSNSSTPTKVWYIGNSTVDHMGTYMLLQVGDERSAEPYVMGIKGWHGQLESRFFTEIADWRTQTIYENDDVRTITEVRLEHSQEKEKSFKITLNQNGEFKLFDASGNSAGVFDTLIVRDYFLNFKRLSFEFFEKTYTQEQRDSVINSPKEFVLSIKDQEGNHLELPIYKRVVPYTDLMGEEWDYDLEKKLAVINENEIVVIQLYTFDRILKPLSYFLRKEEG